MPSFASLGKFFGRTASEGAAFAAGVAVAPALSPVVREIVNEANSKYQTHPIDAGTAAAIVAEDVEQYDFGKAEASFNGVSEARFRAMLGEALNAPGVNELLTAYRRGLITEAMFEHGLRKAKLETIWDAPLKALKDRRLDPAVIATAIQRGIMHDPGFLPVGPPTATGAVPAFPVSPLEPLAEAEAAGIDEARLFVETAIVGLPLSLQQAASAFFRGIIERADFDRAVSEGNTRNEWGPAALEQARQILTAHDYIEGRLRDWIDDPAMYAGTGKHGMSAADTDLLFKVTGRPLSFHQVFIGLRRGGTYDGSLDGIDPAFLKSLRESNIRPEWYNLAWAQRFTLPTLFVVRQWLKDGGDTQIAHDWLWKLGYELVDIERIIAQYAPAGAAAKPAVSAASAVSNAARAIGRAYTGVNITKPKLEQDLAALGENVADYGPQIAAWDAQRQAKLQGLSNTQIRNAYRKAALTEADALALLEAHGMATEEAQAYLGGTLSGLTDEALRAGYRDGAFGLPEVTTILQARGMTYEQAVAYLTA